MPRSTGPDTIEKIMLLPLGGIGGTVAKTATSPLERIRVLAQTGGGEKGIRSTASAIMESEGVMHLYTHTSLPPKTTQPKNEWTVHKDVLC